MNKDSENSFRDHLYTIDESGKRLWVYAKQPKGRLTASRDLFGIALLLFFFTVPFIKIKGQQFLLLDFFHRTFVIFGIQFWPQDFNLFFIGMIALMVFIILFTVTYGRLWCGWACPQTVFMEVIFRRLEYWIEGDYQRQKELNLQTWNINKILRKGLKHGIFYLFSFIIGNYFLMYLIGSGAWITLVTEPPVNHIAGLSGMLIFSFIFYFIFSWFREQVCTIVCPYGRLQGVLLDRDSIVISYDHHRGEQRSPLRKNENRNVVSKGDCIDCLQCVLVCPAGIDIRNGTQLECINCACCIDACNGIMKRVGFRTGLIRYASEKMIADKRKWKFTLRSGAYSFVLIALLAAFGYFLFSKNPVEATVLRSPGMLFQDQGDGRISNLYNIKIVNKTEEDLPIDLRMVSIPGEIEVIGAKPVIKKQSVGEAVFFIYLDRSTITRDKMEVDIGIFSKGNELDRTRATFFGPGK